MIHLSKVAELHEEMQWLSKLFFMCRTKCPADIRCSAVDSVQHILLSENVRQPLFSLLDIFSTLTIAGQNVRQCFNSLPDISKSCRTCLAYLIVTGKCVRFFSAFCFHEKLPQIQGKCRIKSNFYIKIACSGPAKTGTAVFQPKLYVGLSLPDNSSVIIFIDREAGEIMQRFCCCITPLCEKANGKPWRNHH